MQARLVARFVGFVAAATMGVVSPALAAGAETPVAPPTPATSSPGLLGGLLNTVGTIADTVAGPLAPGDGALLALGTADNALGILKVPAPVAGPVDELAGEVNQPAAPLLGLHIGGLDVGVVKPAVANAASITKAIAINAPAIAPSRVDFGLNDARFSVLVPAPALPASGTPALLDVASNQVTRPPVELAMSDLRGDRLDAKQAPIAPALRLDHRDAGVTFSFLALAAVVAAFGGWALARRAMNRA